MGLGNSLRSEYSGKTVLVTGHTGFKGSWLCEWLLQMGARVVGISLTPQTAPALFEELSLENRLEHHICDVRDAARICAITLQTQPDYVFHLAAQSLVRPSYDDPVGTYATNVMGTVHLLESLRALDRHYRTTSHEPCATVFVTSDKCYSNQEWLFAYRENDQLGGHDPYSSSKAASELAIASYRDSYFAIPDTVPMIGIASARAGNVIGGGDWSQDRLLPDCMASLRDRMPIILRSPHATRPWQHVLEPIAGYLTLGQQLRNALVGQDEERTAALCSAFNFGPTVASNRSVLSLVEEITKYWPGTWIVDKGTASKHEASKLNVAFDKAVHLLGWYPRWDFEAGVRRTVEWYRRFYSNGDARELTTSDIEVYCSNSHV